VRRVAFMRAADMENVSSIHGHNFFSLDLQQQYGFLDEANVRRRLRALEAEDGSYNQSGVDAERRYLLDSQQTQPYTTPLFQGMGTHYSFLYVGSPPQRVSVIVGECYVWMSFWRIV
jgi:hypothetical protein